MTTPASLGDWHARASAARRSGEYLHVIDLARQGLEEHPGDLRLEYEKTLAYARAGATGEAEANLTRLATAGALDAIEPAALRTDFGALRARLMKDRAAAAAGPERTELARAAAAAYEAVFDRSDAYFPAINAATLYSIAGDVGRSRSLALAAIDRAAAEPASYWQGATIAEAQLLLGNDAAAAAALRDAVAAGPHLDELASTRRQLAWLCQHADRPGILATLPAPYVLHWTVPPLDDVTAGHATEIPRFVAARTQGGLPLLAYGAIIGPADIGVAEAFIDAGAHVNLVIACQVDLCVRWFEAGAGPEWARRLRAVLDGARSVTEVTLEGDTAERTVSEMALQQARGLAIMRAAALVTTAHELRLGPDAPRAAPGLPGRIPMAFVFGDIKGFSTIPEAAHRPFLDHVIGGFADALEDLRPVIQYTETAGDGIFVVLTSVTAALRCCHGLQRSMDPARLARFGLPATLALRLGAHVGPTSRGLDRVTGLEKFIGKEVIRTARIEAVTPVGQTYVTEQFAATLHSLSPVGHACEYVGWQAMAKGFGRCRMYSLRPTPGIIALLQE